MMTPTPPPKPHLGSGLTNSFPAMSNIAPKNPSRQQPASGMGPLGGHFQEEITSSEWSVSAGSHSGSSGVPQMSAPTPQITPQPLHGNSFTGTNSGSHSGMLMPPPEDRRARRVAVWLVGIAALLVIGLAGAVGWTRYGGALTAGLDAVQSEVGRMDAPAVDPTATTLPLAPRPEARPTAEITPPVPNTATDPVVADSPRTNRPWRPGRPQRPTEPVAASVEAAQPTPPVAPAAPETAARGFLSLVTSPWTTVTVDGRSLGETPLQRVPLAPGTYSLRLRNPDAAIDETYEVTIEAGATTTRGLGLR